VFDSAPGLAGLATKLLVVSTLDWMLGALFGKRTVIASRDYWAAKQVVILKYSTDPRPQECFQKWYYTKSVDEFQDPRPKYLVNINTISIDLYFETRPQTPVASNNKYNFN
jgi:hypothetical protein